MSQIIQLDILLLLLLAFIGALLVGLNWYSKRWSYQVKLINGESFVGHKTLRDAWSEIPWTRWYTVDKASWDCSPGAHIRVPVSSQVYVIVSRRGK